MSGYFQHLSIVLVHLLDALKSLKLRHFNTCTGRRSFSVIWNQRICFWMSHTCMFGGLSNGESLRMQCQTCQTMLRYVVISTGQLSPPERPCLITSCIKIVLLILAELPNCSSTTIHFHEVLGSRAFRNPCQARPHQTHWHGLGKGNRGQVTWQQHFWHKGSWEESFFADEKSPHDSPSPSLALGETSVDIAESKRAPKGPNGDVFSNSDQDSESTNNSRIRHSSPRYLPKSEDFHNLRNTRLFCTRNDRIYWP